MDVAGIVTELRHYNLEHCDPPLADEEVEKIARSIASYPQRPPLPKP
jgi:hypothetical protein